MRSRHLVVSLMVVGLFGALVSEASALDRAPLRAWARQVCAAAGPGVERAAAYFAAVEPLEPGPVSTIEEMVETVMTGDALVAGMSETLAGLRDGIAAAGVPRMSGGARAVRAVSRDLEVILGGLGEMRAVYARFLEDPRSDPAGAAAEVESAFKKYLAPEVFDDLGEHWPKRWTRAMRRAPDCVRLGEMLDAAADAF